MVLLFKRTDTAAAKHGSVRKYSVFFKRLCKAYLIAKACMAGGSITQGFHNFRAGAYHCSLILIAACRSHRLLVDVLPGASGRQQGHAAAVGDVAAVRLGIGDGLERGHCGLH